MSEQVTVDPSVLQGLYEHYLHQSIRLTEENVRLRVQVAALSARDETESDD